MKKYLAITVWSVGLFGGMHGVWAFNAHNADWGIGLEIEPFHMPYHLGNFWGEGLDDLFWNEVVYADPAPDVWGVQMDILRSRLQAFVAVGGVDLRSYLRRRDVGQVYPIQLLLEFLEREYPNVGLLAETQQRALQAIYSQVFEIIRLIALDPGLLLEDERCHVADVLGLLLRASGSSLRLRAWSFHLLFQRFIAEKRSYKATDYIEIWAKALASGSFPSEYVHQLRQMLLDCLGDDIASEAQKAAMRALGVLLGNVELEECFQAEILRHWLDLFQCADERSIQSIVQGMQFALRGAFLSEAMRDLIFEALLLCPNSSHFPQFQYRTMGSLIDRALLDTWAEGLRAGWFSEVALVQLVPVVMDYRFVRDCPIRTQGVIAALIGLLHARAEDSTFRQIVYQHIGEILFAEGQGNVVITGGLEQLSELFVSADLAAWERAKIIAYLVALFPKQDGYFLSGSFADALIRILGCDSLSLWERSTILSLMRRLCVVFESDLDTRREAIVAAVEGFGQKKGGVSQQEGALMRAIVESLPGDDDDLDLKDNDLD